jgi:hypothetical protein
LWRGSPTQPSGGHSKNELKPHLLKEWVIPPRESTAFVWLMEAVLDLYKEPYDEERPVVCFETSGPANSWPTRWRL